MTYFFVIDINSCYKSEDGNVLLSGSWDNNIFAWDLRSNSVIRTIHGPHIAGQSVDIQNDLILAGSFRDEYCIETWDFGTGKKLKELQLKTISDTNNESKTTPLLVYQAMYTPTNGIGSRGTKMNGVGVACGTGANCVVMFDTKTGAVSNQLTFNDEYDNVIPKKTEKDDKTNDMNRCGIYCVDFDPLGEYIVFGGDNGKIGIGRINVCRTGLPPTQRSKSLPTDLFNM